MYTTQNNRQINKQLDRKEEGVDRFIQHKTFYRDREIAIQRGGGGSYRQMYTTQNNRQINKQLDRKEEEVDRCIQHRTFYRDREIAR